MSVYVCEICDTQFEVDEREGCGAASTAGWRRRQDPLPPANP